MLPEERRLKIVEKLFIDSSTTGYIFAEELLRRSFSSLNIITNSPALLDSIRGKRQHQTLQKRNDQRLLSCPLHVFDNK
jgi:hypothetical protein